MIRPYQVAAAKHYRVHRQARMLAPGAPNPLSDYPWWSALWDVLLTLAGAWSVEMVRVLVQTFLAL